MSTADHAVAVVPLAAEDYEGWRTCFRGYCDFYETPFTESLAQTVFHGMILSNEAPLSALLAKEEDGTVVGLAHFRSAPSSLDGATTCFLDDLFTAPHVRGKGIGKALIYAVCAAAQRKGENIVQWSTFESNTVAQRLYNLVARRTSWVPYLIRFQNPDVAPSAPSALPEVTSAEISVDRNLREEDFERWNGLFEQYAAFYESPFQPNADGSPSPVPRIVFFEWLLNPNHLQKALVARRHGEIVGFAHYRPRPRSLNGGDVGYLDDLFVDPLHRGKGVADALLQEFFRVCREKSWPRAHWLTAPTNIVAQRVYERNGASRSPSMVYEMSSFLPSSSTN